MPHTLFEIGIFFIVYVQSFFDEIYIFAVVSHIDAEAGGVVNDYYGHNNGNGERSRVYSGVIADGSHHGSHKSGMDAGHMAVTHGMVQGVSEILAVAEIKDDELYYPGDEKD
jgi:hypothetical protein